MNDEERKEPPQPGGEEQQSGGTAGEQDTAARGPRRLFRSRDDRVLGGVAGGLGRYFGVDPIFFRIGFVALAFFGGAGFLLYLAAWIFVPAEDSGRALDTRLRGRALTLVGAVVLGIAALSLLGAVFDHGGWGWWWWGGFIGPLGLIAIAAVLAWALLSDRDRDRPQPTPASETGSTETAVTETAPVRRTPGVDARWIIGRLALVIAIVAGGTVLFFGSAFAAAAGGGVAVAALVVAIGAMLAVAAFRGGARWLIAPALLLAIPAGVVSAAEVDLDGGIGEREYRPASVTDLRDRYELGMGRLEVDLRDVRLPGGDRPLQVDLGIGEAVVIVPEDVCVALDSRVGAGYARLFDRDSGGLDVDWDSTPTAGPRVPRLVLDAEVGMGALQVVHEPSDVYHRDRWGPGRSIEDSAGNVGCERRPAANSRGRVGSP